MWMRNQKEKNNAKYYKQYLAFEMEDKLMMIDVVNDTYYRGSQYALLKLLFDELEFPYEEAK